MKTAYFDAFSGLSGDMIVGAILDCGANFDEFERAIASNALRPKHGIYGVCGNLFSVTFADAHANRFTVPQGIRDGQIFHSTT